MLPPNIINMVSHRIAPVCALHLLVPILFCFIFPSALLVHGVYTLGNLTTCLTSINHTAAQSNPSVFAGLLDFSLQNLRFTEPGVAKPLAIVLPHSVKQVQQAWACLTRGNWTVRVRSNGHSYEGLSFTANAPFVIVDLTNLKNVNVDLASKTAWVEAGATVGEVYYAISQKTSSYGFAAGTCATIGVGGHFSGGGYGMLSRKYGVAADNVVDAQIVNSSGSILTSVSTTDKELFWALRGGGGGTWGIVVAWKIKLVPVPPTVTTFSIWKTGTQLITDLVYHWQNVAPVAPDELFNAVYMAAINVSGSMDMGASFYGQYLGSINETVALLNQIYPDLGVTAENCKEGTWIQAITSTASVSSPSALTNRQQASKDYFKAKSDYVKTQISKEALAGAFQILKQNANGWMIFEPYGGVMDRISWNAIAFPHRAGNMYVIQYQAWWSDNASPDAAYMAWVRRLYSYMGAYVSQSPRAAYVNYVDLDLGNASVAGQSYFLNNFARLLKVKARVDPLNRFNSPQGVPLTYTA